VNSGTAGVADSYLDHLIGVDDGAAASTNSTIIGQLRSGASIHGKWSAPR
jgi:hypothetical protein